MRIRSRSSGCRPAAPSTSRPSVSGSASRTCSSARSRCASTRPNALRRGRAHGHGAPAPALPARDVRASRRERAARRSPTPATPAPSEKLVELARDADLFLCEATLERGELDGEPRGHLAADEAVSIFEESGARRLLLTHRPAELPLDPRPRTRLRGPRAGDLARRRGSRARCPRPRASASHISPIVT